MDKKKKRIEEGEEEEMYVRYLLRGIISDSVINMYLGYWILDEFVKV